MNRVRQPRTLLVLGHIAGMGTAAGADELVEIPAQNSLTRTKTHSLHLSTSLRQKTEQLSHEDREEDRVGGA